MNKHSNNCGCGQCRNNSILVVFCKEASKTYGLTKDRYYKVEEIDRDNQFVYVINDHRRSVNVRLNRFASPIEMNITQFNNQKNNLVKLIKK